MALVTGASRGVGRETALVLARRGYDVALTVAHGGASYPVPGSLHTTAAEIVAAGVRALPLVMDLHDLAGVRGAVGAVLAQWGRIDLLVLNAHEHVPHAPLLELTLADLRRSLEANHVHQVALVQAALPAMLAAGGATIVLVCDAAARTDPPASPGPGGSVAWGLGHSSALAAFGRIAGAVNAEYAAAGVRAFNVDPGLVVTESGTARGDTAATGVAPTPPDAVGRCAAWLASSRDADRFLGRVVSAAELVESL